MLLMFILHSKSVLKDLKHIFKEKGAEISLVDLPTGHKRVTKDSCMVTRSFFVPPYRL